MDKYRKRILDISQTVTAAHVAPAFSCIDIVDVLYNRVLRPGERFVMSKGHGCLAQYVLLEEKGLDLSQYCKGKIGAHPDLGVAEASTGSLGHGLGMCVGMAYARPEIVYCLISDGELQEGSTWEAFMMGANLRLNNLVVIVDNNDFQGLGRTSTAHPAFYPIEDKVKSFGWSVSEIDGHDKDEIFAALTYSRWNAPFVLICKTIKGKGVSFMEEVPIWHYRSPNKEEYEKACAELVR